MHNFWCGNTSISLVPDECLRNAGALTLLNHDLARHVPPSCSSRHPCGMWGTRVETEGKDSLATVRAFFLPPRKRRILVVDFNSIFLGTWESLCKWTRCQFIVKVMCALLQILLDTACPQRPPENTMGHMCSSSAKRILGLPGRVKRWRVLRRSLTELTKTQHAL